MDRWLTELADELAQLETAGLRRRLRVIAGSGKTVQLGSRSLINLSSNDYLGLSTHPHLREAAAGAVGQIGVGAGASRLAGGHLDVHADLESRFADFKHAEAALLCPTGYMANHAAVTSLARPGDLVCLDKLNHASLIDAARASGATLRTFGHRQYDKLERLLSRFDGPGRKLIVTDSVFSMDGDLADLPRLCDLADRHEAILIVDEAHATGVLGPSGAGLCQAQGVSDRVDVVVSTASKALGSLGGIVTGPRIVIDTIVNRARSFIYTTAVPPVQAATIAAALDVVRDEPWRRTRLADLSSRLGSALTEASIVDQPPTSPTPIMPIIVGSPETALHLAAHLEQAGFLAPAIRPPTVPPGSARVRISLRADLDDDDVDRLATALRTWRRPTHHS